MGEKLKGRPTTLGHWWVEIYSLFGRVPAWLPEIVLRVREDKIESGGPVCGHGTIQEADGNSGRVFKIEARGCFSL